MAARVQKHTFDSIMRDLRAGNYAPVYMLMGEEGYYIDKISDFIADNALPESERDFNQTIVYAADTSPMNVAEMARRYPMMSERQVIIVKEAQGFKDWSPIEKYLDNVMSTTILVFCHKHGSMDKRKKITLKLEQKAVVFESPKVQEAALPKFIVNYLKEKNVEIEHAAVGIIADHIGQDLNRVVTELDKLVVGLDGNNRQVTPEIVESKIGISKDFNVYELKNALINRDVLKANIITNYFDKNSKEWPVQRIVPALFGYFQNLMIAQLAPDKNNLYELAKFLGFGYAKIAEEYMAGLRTFSASKTKDIISKLREIDAKSKGLDNPSTSGGELLRELVYFILN